MSLEVPKKKGKGFREGLKSLIHSPAKSKYNKVLAESYQSGAATKQEPTSAEGNNLALVNTAEMSEKQKAKALVAQRNAMSPTGSFVLGVYKPLATSQGYETYYTAKGATIQS
jgi:hypothetical protein